MTRALGLWPVDNECEQSVLSQREKGAVLLEDVQLSTLHHLVLPSRVLQRDLQRRKGQYRDRILRPRGLLDASPRR